ncbi:uncharacterized protein J4E79_009616 [Alternaria viburni]|uniref:uncharacterized protein n=1 Tax=Alternaria viburni TaxID=566460 RepID=UPI0020C399B3|nr:uncharacterized protein J4E79_009616 [Alternaria viburni]KAI4649771.1 hypothetical protein J4E79_009616 [Alternaria viburni]
MADPLSIAGSVVGITAAGVQACVKLYALAEKVATASQRVTSIADDISSTCAILNQVRELIIPQPDAQGTLKSVFNSVALNDISHALRRCRASFTDIEALLRRAFEQVGKRPALRSNIKLSRFEQAKWPFLQPQFDELRNDLRDAKGNLVLMIAVASLALAQRDGRQRPIHDTERLDLGSTIVQLHRASTVKTQPQQSFTIARNEMELPHASLEKLVKTYTDEGKDPHIAMSELTREQQTMIKETTPEKIWEIAYVRLQRNISVSSVFGTLNVETLKWIFKMEIKEAKIPAGVPGLSGGTALLSPYKPSSPLLTPPASSTPDLNHMPSTGRSEQAGEILRKEVPEARFKYLVGSKRKSSFLGYSGKSSTAAFKPGEESVTPEPDPDFYPITDLSSAENPAPSTITLADADDESDDEPDDEPPSVVEYSSSPHPWEDSMPYYPETTQKPSQPAEDNGQDIVQELLARWTVS